MVIPRPRRTAVALAREATGLLELPRLALRFPTLALQPRGRGEPVMVLPGYGADDGSTLVLQGYLRWLGYRAQGWELGRNDGAVPRLLPLATQRVEAIADAAGAPVALVGWSLGGYIAREVARDLPARVTQVVTLGTPVVGGPKYTSVASAYRRRGVDLDAVERAVRERARRPIRRPITAIFSRNDQIVSWQACIDTRSPEVEHVEADATHVGLGFPPDVFRILATRLARGGGAGSR